MTSETHLVHRISLKTLDIAKETNDKDFLGRIFTNLGSIYLYQDMLTTALDYEKKGAEIFSLLNV